MTKRACDGELPSAKHRKLGTCYIRNTLVKKAKDFGLDVFSVEFAELMDSQDPLRSFRERFHLPLANPKVPSAGPAVYLCGNSLGLQPVTTKKYVDEFLNDWSRLGVNGHFTGRFGWKDIHEILTEGLMELAGAKEALEVCAMNSLTVNINLMFVPFYRPTPTRHKILLEGKSFPSDRYAVEAQIKFHGYDPANSLVEMFPREGMETLLMEDILEKIKEEGDSIALVFFSGVQYYTGQLFDIAAITREGHKKGCVVGFDLAHAFGNVPLSLHDWDVDFAVWCSYKYLNAGPGSTAGIFVHSKHAYNTDLPRFAGWWGQEKETRFKMEPTFRPIPGAEGYQMSNPPVLPILQNFASIEIFREATMERLRDKSLLLTGYLEMLLLDVIGDDLVAIVTPSSPEERGCQLSLQFKTNVKKVHERIEAAGVICDLREPDVMRIAPTPLYNSFLDVYKFCQLLREHCK